jgi:decaprenylphospho-beta-D-erythro-pentofuranosid-2-ulose 2-reductase
MTNISWKRAIIVGASSGMGEALARKLAKEGCSVALVARRADTLAKLATDLNQDNPEIAKTYPHDVKDFGAVSELFQTIVQDLGGLDLIVYASGVMPYVAHDEYDIEKDAEMIAVNFTGGVAWLNEAARRFEKAGSGTIVGISSVAGDRGRRGSPVYGATKAAFAAYLESLRNRIGRYGAQVITVKPGPVATPMTQGLGKMPFQISADRAADEILAGMRDGVQVVYVTAKWRIIMKIITLIPSPIFKRMNI